MKFAIAKILTALIIVQFLSGCAGISDYYVSKSSNTGNNVKHWANGVVRINLDDMTVYFKPDNEWFLRDGTQFFVNFLGEKHEISEKYKKGAYIYRKEAVFRNGNYMHDSILGDYFYIEICIRPNQENIVFNPREVYLQLEEGQYIQASKYLKPHFNQRSPNPNEPERIVWAAEKGWAMEGNEQVDTHYFSLPRKHWTGFAIRFETPTPNPGTPFSIEIRGLQRLGEAIEVPRLIFKDKKIWRDYRF